MRIKRIMAYFIDLMFVALLTTMLSQIRFLNPNYEEFVEANIKYNEVYANIIEEDNLNFVNDSEFKDAFYEVEKTGLSNSIMIIIVYIAYFVGFQFWNKGQTLGKKVFKIKVVNNDNNDLKWYQLLLRAIIIYNIYAEIIFLILLLFLNVDTFMNTYYVMIMITTVIFWISAIMIIVRKDERGLHDIIAGTKVVEE